MYSSLVLLLNNAFVVCIENRANYVVFALPGTSQHDGFAPTHRYQTKLKQYIKLLGDKIRGCVCVCVCVCVHTYVHSCRKTFVYVCVMYNQILCKVVYLWWPA